MENITKFEVFGFSNLPPDMMKETQSRSQILTYERLSPNFLGYSSKSPEIHEKEKNELEEYTRILHSSTDRFSRINLSNKLENRLMDKKMMKMIVKLLNKVLR